MHLYQRKILNDYLVLQDKFQGFMKIAIIGAGFAGLATTWHLLNNQSPIKDLEISVFDIRGIGGGSSVISAGLLHPYAGLHAKLARFGLEGWQSTIYLMEQVSKFTDKPFSAFNGLLRIAATEIQQNDFYKSSKMNPKINWLTNEDCKKLIPGSYNGAGIFIEQAAQISSQDYLKALWKACSGNNVLFIQKEIETLEELSNYDKIICAGGGEIYQIREFQGLSPTLVKGQILQMSWPTDIPPLPFPVSSQVYVLMEGDTSTCLVGATFEKKFMNIKPDLYFAKGEILPKAQKIFPFLTEDRILDCRSGFRVSTPDHLPAIQQWNERCWIYTGLGSKGLLYHSYYAQKLSKLVLGKSSIDRS